MADLGVLKPARTGLLRDKYVTFSQLSISWQHTDGLKSVGEKIYTTEMGKCHTALLFPPYFSGAQVIKHLPAHDIHFMLTS